MKHEKSCGAVIYKINEKNEIIYLLSEMGFGHISLSKGHMEGTETEFDTAKREIFEETSLTPIIDTNFRKIISYSPAKNVMKEVVFFVAKCEEDTEPVDKHDDEVIGFLWLPYSKAIYTLSHSGDKKVLKAANKYILKNLKN